MAANPTSTASRTSAVSPSVSPPVTPGPSRQLHILTGVPGSGKSSAASEIASSFKPDWTLLRADDFIGPTFHAYKPRPWGEIRAYHHRWAGNSAGWHMTQGRNVLVEGHVKDSNELGLLEQGVRDLFGGDVQRKVVFLDGDTEEIVARLTANPYREPEWSGPDRADRFRYWITQWAVERGIADRVVDSRGLSPREVAQAIAKAFA